MILGETLLHSLIAAKRESAAIFLSKRKVNLNLANKKVCLSIKAIDHCVWLCEFNLFLVAEFKSCSP